MTELNTKIRIGDLVSLAEPVNINDLRDGSPLEIMRVGKNLKAITHYIYGLQPSDNEEAQAIELIREHALLLSDQINSLRFSGLSKLDCGSSLAEAYELMAGQVEFLIDLFDSDSVSRIDRALLAS